MVEKLRDGRLFVPDTALVEAPDLAEWFATKGANYWRRDWNLQGFVGPMEEDVSNG